MARPEEVRGIFTAIAGGYDRFNDVASLGIDRLWRREAVRRAALFEGARVLDLAAGTGDLSLALAREKKAGLIVSSDFTPAMLSRAQAKARGLGLPTAIAFALADALRLPFRDQVFDVATVAFGVRNLSDRAAGFCEAKRVLKPGGRLVILELTRPPSAFVRAAYGVYRRHALPLLGRLVAGEREPYEYLDRSIEAFPLPAELSRERMAAGFEKAEHASLTFGVVAIHVAFKAGASS